MAEAQKRDMALFSREYMETAPLLTAQHPDWGYRYVGYGRPLSNRDKPVHWP